MHFPLSKMNTKFLVLLLCIIVEHGYGRNASLSCTKAERQALLSFKNGLLSRESVLADPFPSWGSGDDKKDCCKWSGVRCSNHSGHVVSLVIDFLDRKAPPLKGNLNLLLLELRHLNQLRLTSVSFGGSRIPSSIGMLSRLTELTLVNNGLIGKLPKELGNLSRLELLDLGSNDLHGSIPKTFSKLISLKYLNLAQNRLSSSIPDIFWNMSNLYSIDLENNTLEGEFPRSIWNLSSLTYLRVQSNELHGCLPKSMSQLRFLQGLQISNNSFHGEITEAHFSNLSMLKFLDLSSNRFSKLNLPCNVSNDSPLEFLDLSNNELSGELADCWSPFKLLKVLVMSNNSLSGRVPSSFGSMNNIRYLQLNRNDFSGDLPWALRNCRNLLFFDIGENNLSGTIPMWLGENLSNLVILRFRNNSFNGGIPSSLCNLSILKVLDLSSNNIIGGIPNCISLLRSMTEEPSFRTPEIQKFFGFPLVILHRLFERSSDIETFISAVDSSRNIDLSSNKLIGKIPAEMTKLRGLISINLSRNNLNGQIPIDIGRMKFLEALDLSRNYLVGRIPQSLSQIDGLCFLDLSNNNLSGKIPTGNQLQTILSTAYEGNAEICGFPFPKKCSVVPNPEFPKDSDKLLNRGFFVSMAIGFATAFWGVCGVLIFKKSFRHAYFKLLNDVGDWVHVK